MLADGGPAPETEPGARRRILVVDDSRMQRALICDMLQSVGYEPVPCESGEEALAAVEQQTPAAVLLDVNLAGQDGFEVCRALREIVPSPPVLLLTARQTAEDVRLGILAGADEYLVKPVDEVVLEAVLKRTIAASASEAPDLAGIVVAEPGFLVGSGASIAVDVHRLSELGASLLADSPLAHGERFELVTACLAHLGLRPLYVGVDACRQASGTTRRFIVEVTFWGLPPAGRNTLRRFVYAHHRY
jgi:CheY-like chemotaxis protein